MQETGTITPAAKRTRNTQQRRAVLEAVQSLAGRHPTASEVFAEVRGTHPHLSLATVYRALHALVEQRVIGEMRVENVSRFDAGPTSHNHLVCRRCGRVTDVHADVPETLLHAFLPALADQGFTLDLHPIQFSGVCADCQ